MSRITQLLKHVEQLNPQLAADLTREYTALSGRRAFGLNFERHTPETVELPGRAVRVNDKVRFLPARGDAPSTVADRLGRVRSIALEGATKTATLVASVEDSAPAPTDAELEVVTRNIDDVVVVAEFRDPIYPGLVSTGQVERGGDKPFHTVINAENYHALQTLQYTHTGRVDVIYIDPPYNTGAKDWKYNNDYVDGEDIYRHSKWLAFMERRLKVAQRLLNPAESVLIVTIDEKEYLRLGLLLEQTFPEARITMVTSSINSAGATRKGTFPRAAEYLFFVQQGTSRPVPLELGEDWNAVKTDNKLDIYWSRLIRSGADSARADSANQFYPIFVRNTDDGPVIDSIEVIDSIRRMDASSMRVVEIAYGSTSKIRSLMGHLPRPGGRVPRCGCATVRRKRIRKARLPLPAMMRILAGRLGIPPRLQEDPCSAASSIPRRRCGGRHRRSATSSS